MIALLRPSRGLLFSESENSCWHELRSVEHDRIPSHDKPIPKAFNYIVEKALKTKADAFWFVEEDTVVPEGGLVALLALGTDISAINYKLKKGSDRLSEWRWNGELIWCSLGCTLVKRRVFERLTYPWFSTDYSVAEKITGSKCDKKFLGLVKRKMGYGGQDLYLAWRAREAGFTIGVVEGMLCRHLILEKLGQQDSNEGCHTIRDCS
jgi:GT2 family glycosyltransferase